MPRIKVSKEEQKITLYNAFDEFVQLKKSNNLSESTIKNYEYSFKVFCQYMKYDSDTLCEDVKGSAFIKYKNHLLKEPVSTNTINHYLRDLSAIFRWFAANDWMEDISIQKVKVQEERLNYYNEQEMQVLLQKPVGNLNFGAWRTWAIICFIYSTAARAQSVCDVRMDDIDFYRKEVTFRHQKNKSLLILPITEQLERILKEYIKKCGLTDHTYLFPEINGEKLTPNGLRLSINRYCKSREIDPKGVHALRHAFASQYIRNGGNVVKLQRILNHASLKTTEKYLHMLGEDIAKDYTDFSPLDNALKKKSRSKKV